MFRPPEASRAPVLRSTMASFEKPPPVGNGRRPDAIILDISMPHIDGFELAKKLKLGFPGVCVVAISGHSSDEHRKRAPHAGFDGLRYQARGCSNAGEHPAHAVCRTSRVVLLTPDSRH